MKFRRSLRFMMTGARASLTASDRSNTRIKILTMLSRLVVEGTSTLFAAPSLLSGRSAIVGNGIVSSTVLKKPQRHEDTKEHKGVNHCNFCLGAALCLRAFVASSGFSAACKILR